VPTSLGRPAPDSGEHNILGTNPLSGDPDPVEHPSHPTVPQPASLLENLPGPLDTGAPKSEPLFIRIQTHPRASREDRIVRLDSPEATALVSEVLHNQDLALEPATSPWFPFKTRADYELARLVILGGLSEEFQNEVIAGATQGSADISSQSRPGYVPPHNWFDGQTNVTFTGRRDLFATVERAVEYIQEVRIRSNQSFWL
jgi:hypothetical protein